MVFSRGHCHYPQNWRGEELHGDPVDLLRLYNLHGATACVLPVNPTNEEKVVGCGV